MTQMVFTLILLVAAISTVECMKVNQMPQIYGDKVPQRMISTKLKRVQRRIVMLHDYFRTKVLPPASNMLSMQWHNGAARAAQKWADQCRFLVHDPVESRAVKHFPSCGQNIFVSSHKVHWLFALQSWFVEREQFVYGSKHNNSTAVGHYTQMVWAATHKVGCGITKCSGRYSPRGKPFFNYVCNYCPTGNFEDSLGLPYKSGQPCSACPNSCRSDKIRLCTNTCNAADQLSNCKALHNNWSTWLCNTRTTEGFKRRKSCLATCSCKGKIYD
ncbi:cysteine-rich venom protein pseudecin-like [Bradysia coprophila]|uniref:cysteine-rich venom protein pseudecin-like n=1 Tax=Bradysia coprophila TaxID=38358 RepID=UPI00187D9026|nr:cysteine-rich venom protein pseudecin-like [Bradysia coprophila]XP_037032259.1 cysteine-rich venom protein pseudecin-like [Bradysia coprophila]XP_037032263.1 cysteine-rich venom protein pseudecin-like [Bradysia coprophila]